MPTILNKDGFRVFFFSNEGNEPPHVHIEYGGGYAKFWLNPIELSISLRLTSRQLSKLRNLVEENQENFNTSWHEYFN